MWFQVMPLLQITWRVCMCVRACVRKGVRLCACVRAFVYVYMQHTRTYSQMHKCTHIKLWTYYISSRPNIALLTYEEPIETPHANLQSDAVHARQIRDFAAHQTTEPGCCSDHCDNYFR